ncbi:ATP-binding protein [Amorphus sp. 3PC139-8]|uniref:ATP-binding protein n=1 Tax=Amorphus sp. 3PC139-8 TaxID=2735676 RepID=UPI00345D8CB7
MDDAYETFLTLCAHPEVGNAVGDVRPAFVVSLARAEMVWANAAGARLCGLSSVYEFGAGMASRARTIAHDLAQQIRPHISGERTALCRIRDGLSPIVLDCRVRAISTGELRPYARVLVVAPAPDDEREARPLAAFAEFVGGSHATIVNADGTLVAGDRGLRDSRPGARRVPIGATGLTLRLPDPPPQSFPLEETDAIRTPRAADLGAKAVTDRAPEQSDTVPETEAAKTGLVVGDASQRPRPVRFTWQSDADDRISYLSPEFAQALGSSDAILGRSWQELARSLAFDPDGTLMAALSDRVAWSGTTIFWPTSAAGGRVPVDVAGLAIQDAERRFVGFRGFGLIRLGEVDTSVAPAESPPSAGLERSAPAPDDEAVAATSQENVAETEPVLAASPSNVVRLHRHEPAEPQPTTHLSRPEREAFRMIAAALGARFEGDETPPTPSEPAEQPAPAPKPASIVRPARFEARPGPMPSAFATVASQPDTRILDRLPLALVVSQRDRLVHVNAAALSLLGYPNADALAKAGGVAALFANTPSPSGAADNAILLKQADGTTIPAEVRLHTVPWGEERALLVILRALPADHRGEEARMSEDRDDERSQDSSSRPPAAPEDVAPQLTGVLNAIPDAVFVIDPDGTVVLANHGAEAIFRRPTTAFRGMRLEDLLDGDSGEIVDDLLEQIATGSDPTRPRLADEVIGLRPNQGPIPLALSIGLVGNGPRLCAVMRDVARWKSAEAQFSEATRAAETANAQKSDMLARISHEIRTPLNAILGFTDVMLAEKLGPLGNERYRDYLRDISISGQHILSLVNDLLDLSKIEAGKLDLSFEPVAMNEIARDCTNLMEPQAESDRVEIRSRLQENLPRILADTRSLRQITLNLLSNAIKFNRTGGVVSLSTFQDETGAVILRVSDNGIGMSEDDLAAAMEPFRRVGKSPKNGTGLGLPLTKALAEANRADFKIRSEPNRGTVVDITFPAPRVLAA